MISMSEEVAAQCQKDLLTHTGQLSSENGLSGDDVSRETELRPNELLVHEVPNEQEPSFIHHGHSFGCPCPQCEEFQLMVYT